MFSSYVNSNDSHNLVNKERFLYTDSTPMDLLKIYNNILNRKNKKHPVHIIKKATYSVKDMGTIICKRILTSIKQKSICTFAELLQDHNSQADRVLCFVVLLELSKFQYVHLSQENHLSEIDIHPTFCELPKLQEFDSTNVAAKSSLPKLSLHN